MERYDYRAAVKADVLEYISDNYRFDKYLTGDQLIALSDWDELEADLNDELWTADSVTGNGSGSYTFNAWQAEEYLCHNLDLLGEALGEFGCGPEYMIEHGPEACDVTIRCYLLGEAIAEALAEIRDHLASIDE